MSRYVRHAVLTASSAVTGQLRDLEAMPQHFAAVVLDGQNGQPLKIKLHVTLDGLPAADVPALGPWVEQLLGRELTAGERDALEAMMRDLAGLAQRQPGEPPIGPAAS